MPPFKSKTFYNSQSGAYSLDAGLVRWLACMLLAVGYFTLLYRSFRGKVTLKDTGAGGGYCPCRALSVLDNQTSNVYSGSTAGSAATANRLLCSSASSFRESVSYANT